MRALLLTFGLLLAGAALAARPPAVQDFQPPSDAERAAAKEKPRSNVTGYTSDPIAKAAPFPWGTVLFFAVVLAVAAPFGIRQYLNTARQIEEQGDIAGPEA
jgi:hypothetical protein